MQSKKIYKTIFIDWSNTLSNSLFWSQMADPSHAHNSYFNKIIEIVFKSDKEMVDSWMRGIYSAEDISFRLEKLIDLDREIILDELKKSCERMEFVSSKIPKLIQSLRNKKIRVGVASDNMDTFMRFTCPAMKLSDIFDDFLVSSDMGYLKKDLKNGRPVFFEKYIKENNLDYSQILLIDDSIDIIDPYRRIGLKVVNVKNKSDLEKVLNKYAA